MVNTIKNNNERKSKSITTCSFFVFIIFMLMATISTAQNKPLKKPTRILFIIDASGSMAGKWQQNSKMDAAKAIMMHMADSLSKENISFAVRIFGHQKEKSLNDCSDSKLELPFSKSSKLNLSTVLSTIEPKGYSPIALSLEQAINDFPLTKYEVNNIIVLITDGFENCEGDPCVATKKLQAAGIYLRPYIIGLGLNEEQKNNFDCVGQLFEANESSKDFKEMITEVVITTIMNPTSLQINLLNEAERPTETNVNMTFSDHANSSIKYNIIHTLNYSNNPDTLFIDPLKKYDVKIHTIPTKKIDNIELVQGKHIIKAIEAPQGSLKFVMTGTSKYKNLKCIIKQKNNVINVQDINTSLNYITGNYDIEILTLPRITMNDVNILQSQTKTISIIAPGILTVSKTQSGFLTLLKKDNSSQIKVYSFDISTNKESIQLQPGNYELIYRNKNANSSKSTITKKITIVSGVASNITF